MRQVGSPTRATIGHRINPYEYRCKERPKWALSSPLTFVDRPNSLSKRYTNHLSDSFSTEFSELA
jgi:hypothetical protein